MKFQFGKYCNYEDFKKDWIDEIIELDEELFEYLNKFLWNKLLEEGLDAIEVNMATYDEIFERDYYDYQVDDFDSYKGYETGIRIYQCPFEHRFFGVYITSSRYESEYDERFFEVEVRPITELKWCEKEVEA